MSKRVAITSSSETSVGPYSPAVDSDGLIFCSGQTPLDPETGSLVTGGIGAQTKQCFDNLFGVLEAGEMGPADVVKVNVYLTHMNDFAAMNEVYATRFEMPYPARTTIGVAALPLGAAVEIEMIARRST